MPRRPAFHVRVEEEQLVGSGSLSVINPLTSRLSPAYYRTLEATTLAHGTGMDGRNNDPWESN